MRIKISLTILLLFAVAIVNAQISEGGVPYSFINNLNAPFEQKIMPNIDTHTLLLEDEYTGLNEPLRFGFGFDVSFNLKNAGTWVSLPDGNRIWRLEIMSPEAYSINLLYDKFWLPKGAKLYIYNKQKNMVIGAFSYKNNKPDGKFATGLIKGKSIILEYFEPVNATQCGEISISRVVHGYRNLFNATNDPYLNKVFGFGDSESCNNNVYCPEATGWENEVHSVGIIVFFLRPIFSISDGKGEQSFALRFGSQSCLMYDVIQFDYPDRDN